MKNRAFTLIEVLVSVLIISVVATALFQISTNSKSSFEFLVQKIEFSTICSIPFLHNNKQWHNSNKSLYDFLRSNYNIKNDEFRKFLKETKVHYKQEEFSKLSPLDKSSGVDLNIVFDKIEVTKGEQTNYVYKIFIEN